MEKIGRWAFVAGLVIAVIAAFATQLSWVGWVLAVLGLFVGFLNVTAKETQSFLLAAVALILSAAAVQEVPYVGGVLTTVVANLISFLAAAVLVVALKSLFETARA